jgi:hypothetical protein
MKIQTPPERNAALLKNLPTKTCRYFTCRFHFTATYLPTGRACHQAVPKTAIPFIAGYGCAAKHTWRNSFEWLLATLMKLAARSSTRKILSEQVVDI